MHEAVDALLDQRTVDIATWTSFWDALVTDTLDRGEPIALLASLTTGSADHETIEYLVRSLDLRRAGSPVTFPGAVNVVGTGGGPPTFNVSTAAAFVAAAIGVPVVKTGSRAYTSTCGSLDLLDRLGVSLTRSYDETGEMLHRHGVAFAGYFVYPTELTALARRVAPLSMRSFGRLLNTLGPFLPALPGTAQLTGVSARSVLPLAHHLADRTKDRTIWLCTNDLGVDELISFADNVLRPPRGASEVHVGASQLAEVWEAEGGRSASDASQLRPVSSPSRIVGHFLDVVSGMAGDVATETVCLNAAALAVVGGHMSNWKTAIATARAAVDDGAVLELVSRIRGERRAAPVRGEAAACE